MSRSGTLPTVMNLSKLNFLRRALGLAIIGAAALIAGCGSSGSSTIAVGNESTAANSVVEKTR